MVVSLDTLGFIHIVEGRNNTIQAIANKSSDNDSQYIYDFNNFQDVVIHSISTTANVEKWVLTCNDMIISQGNDSNIDFNNLLPFMCQNLKLQLTYNNDTNDDVIGESILLLLETTQLNKNEVSVLKRMSYFYDVMKYNDRFQIVRYEGGTISLPLLS